MQKYEENKKKWEKQSWDKKNPYNYFYTFLMTCAKNKWKTAEAKVKTCETHNLNKNYVERISAQFEWLDRAEAYHNYLDEEQRKEFEEEYKKICKETIIQIGAMSQIIGQKINADIQSIRDAKGDKEAVKEAIGSMPMNQVAQILKTNQEVLKTILRIPDAQEVNVNGKVATTIKEEPETLKQKLDKLSPEEREMYLDLCDKVNEDDVTDSEQ